MQTGGGGGTVAGKKSTGTKTGTTPGERKGRGAAFPIQKPLNREEGASAGVSKEGKKSH